MKRLNLYIEGGGPTEATQGKIRLGMRTLFAPWIDQMRERGWHVNLVVCGACTETYKQFIKDRAKEPDETFVLLLDSEEPVNAPTRIKHLQDRKEHKCALPGVKEEHVHLMAQAMEAWIAADPDKLEEHYKRNFHKNELPESLVLHVLSPADILKKLEDATKDTPAGKYQKVKHASELLKKIRLDKVRARCPHAETLCATLLTLEN